MILTIPGHDIFMILAGLSGESLTVDSACSADAEIVQHETSHWTRKVQNYSVVKKPDTYDIFSYFLCSLWNGAVRQSGGQ